MIDRVLLFTIIGGALLLLAVVFLLLGGRQARAFQQAYRRLETRDLFLEDVMAASRNNSRLLVGALLLGAVVAGLMAFQLKTGSLPDRPDETAAVTQDAAALRAQLDNAQDAISQLTAENETLRSVSAQSGNTLDTAQIDTLKQQYEKAFVNYYYLKRCNQATLNDALLLHASLSQAMSQAGGPASLVEDIPTTALATYQTLYASSPCDPATLQSLLPATRSYNDAVLRSIAVRFTPPAPVTAQGQNGVGAQRPVTPQGAPATEPAVQPQRTETMPADEPVTQNDLTAPSGNNNTVEIPSSDPAAVPPKGSDSLPQSQSQTP